MIKAQETLASVLRALNRKGHPLDKVVLHKFIYFLDVKGLRAGFRFEPWTYGPFSFDLADALNDMVFWDKIKVDEQNKNRFEIADLSSIPHLDAKVEARIEALLDDFEKIVGVFSFDNLECVGTVLYCAESLAFQSKEITKGTIVKEFQAWKGQKYSEDKIESTFAALKPYLSFS